MSVPQKIRCVVKRIVDHGGRVYSLELQPERPLPQFQPGQFLHLAIDPYEPGDFWPESRVFSIASAPSKRDELTITYSAVGRFTTRMEKTLQVGSEVWVKMPYGDFVVNHDGDVVLIAGGTGITAFTGFLENLAPNSGQKITLFYGARNPELLIFKPLVDRKIQEGVQLSVWYFIEEGQADESAGVIRGRISVESMLPKVNQASNSVFYLSGPPAMLQKISADLKVKDIPVVKIRMDSWE